MHLTTQSQITCNEKIYNIVNNNLDGCLVAGVYGIIHDQLTYTISPEYYTKFKFYQFGLADEGTEAIFSTPRLWVSVVGFMATWWTGVPIAIILGLVSLHPESRSMIAMAMKGFLVTIAITFVTGMFGLYYGLTYLANQPKESFGRWFIPENLIDFKSFIAVGSMHNYSYFGGACGLFVGIAYIRWRKSMIRKRKTTWSVIIKSDHKVVGQILQNEAMELVTYRKFNEQDQVEHLTTILRENKILFEIVEDRDSLDTLYGGNHLTKYFYIKIKQEDFAKADSILLTLTEQELTSVEKDHYLFDFNDEELFEILSKPDEWSEGDYVLAKKILTDRGREISDDTIKLLKTKRVTELAKPEEPQKLDVCRLYICSARWFAWNIYWLASKCVQKDFTGWTTYLWLLSKRQNTWQSYFSDWTDHGFHFGDVMDFDVGLMKNESST